VGYPPEAKKKVTFIALGGYHSFLVTANMFAIGLQAFPEVSEPQLLSWALGLCFERSGLELFVAATTTPVTEEILTLSGFLKAWGFNYVRAKAGVWVINGPAHGAA